MLDKRYAFVGKWKITGTDGSGKKHWLDFLYINTCLRMLPL